MNKYRVVVKDDHYEDVAKFVEADSFYTDRESATFIVGKYDPVTHEHGEAIAYYTNVTSVEKISE